MGDGGLMAIITTTLDSDVSVSPGACRGDGVLAGLDLSRVGQGKRLDRRAGIFDHGFRSVSRGASDCRVGGAGFHVPGTAFLVVGTVGVRWDGQGLDRLRGGGQVRGPGPAGGQVQPGLALSAGEPARDLEEPEPQRLDGGLAQAGVRQAEVSEGGQQAARHGHHGGLGDLDLPMPRGPPVQPDRLGLIDVVLDVHVIASGAGRPATRPARWPR